MLCSGLREERVDGRLELVFAKKARRRSVVFTEVRDDAVAVEPKPISEDLRRVAGFALACSRKCGAPLWPKGRQSSRTCAIDRAR
jgi:hypothetical protein